MDAFTAGTLAGAGSFHCERCGYAIALHERDAVPSCPRCDSDRFARSSMFATHVDATDTWDSQDTEHPEWLDAARESLVTRGDYLAFDDGDRVNVVPLQEGWTRLGRSLAAHVRFDDPTVSRRHALIHREGDAIRVLDDRSLNGVWVNGERVDWRELEDDDEMTIGRFRLYLLRVGRSARTRPATTTH
ncbi:MAG TPA: FHA domain-containing protein [Thermoleophilaceae bacterium]|nr:FHA domain-containing protein [Thermoleophilaceae bacterium]